MNLMEVPLDPEIERIVRQKVASGEYASVADLVEEALFLLVERGLVPEPGRTSRTHAHRVRSRSPTPDGERPAMNLTLNQTSERIVRRKVESGDYPSPDEVVDEALRLLELRDESRREELRREIALGIEETNGGELVDGHEVFDKIRR